MFAEENQENFCLQKEINNISSERYQQNIVLHKEIDNNKFAEYFAAEENEHLQKKRKYRRRKSTKAFFLLAK